MSMPKYSYAGLVAVLHVDHRVPFDEDTTWAIGFALSDFTSAEPGSQAYVADRLDTLIEGFWY